MRLSISDAAGGQMTLAGAEFGRAVLGRLVTMLPAPGAQQLCVLDYNGVDVASGSFIRESTISFRDFARVSRPDLFPVVANASEIVLDDLREVLANRSDAMVTCVDDGAGGLKNFRIVGRLDEKLRLTLELVDDMGEADTGKLREARAGEGVPTVWNNRLSALVSKGLVAETSVGRGKLFKSLSRLEA
ncbi:MAG: hypothetical protein R3C25_09965 [Hyphomonadaceae bacterium]